MTTPNKVSTSSLITLNNNLKIPSIGFGLYQIRSKKEVVNSIKFAYEAGYRLFDTAVMYGNEKNIGGAIKTLQIPRDQIFITTKILPADMTKEKTKISINQSLENLQLSYIDLVLIHWPEVSKKEDRVNVWKTLEEAVKEGKVKMIGVSNFCKKHLEHILNNCEIIPCVNQIECSPIYWDEETISFCKEKGIQIEAYCPLAEWNDKLVENKLIKDVAKKHKKSIAQVALKWSMKKGFIPLPKSVHENYIKENIMLDDFDLDSKDMEDIDKMREINYKIDWDPHNVE